MIKKADREFFHIIKTQQFNRKILDELCELTTAIRMFAKEREGMLYLRSLLADKRAMLYFTQPSTRTFLSFNSACQILGMQTSEIRDPSTSSEIKGESFLDSIRTFSSYVDVIIMRNNEAGKAETCANFFDTIERRIPVINAGSGKDQHPTQALLDIYTLERSFRHRGGIEGKAIGMMGDLARGRTVRSICYLMKHYPGVKLVFISPPSFAMREDIKKFLTRNQVQFYETQSLKEVWRELDALYVTRIQDEHDKKGESQAIDMSSFRVTQKDMKQFKKDGVIMHPLPRREEIDPAIDSDPRAKFWRQERNGMWMRVAILSKIFGAHKKIVYPGL